MSGSGFQDGFGMMRASLEDLNNRLDGIVSSTTNNVIGRSVDRPAMALAYASLSGKASGDIGRQAFHRALTAEGMTAEQINRLDALFVRCLLDPSLEEG